MTRRGLSLLELLLALMVTTMIAGAIAGMMGAVSTGVRTRRDARQSMICAHASAARLNAYVAPARALLQVGSEDCVLWLADARESGTVHASEVRWLTYDAGARTLAVKYVSFPESWGDVARDLEDVEYASDADWDAALQAYESKDLVASIVLIDMLDGVRFRADTDPLDARHLSVDLEFAGANGPITILTAATLRRHEPPKG